jgi:hypothetical protein
VNGNNRTQPTPAQMDRLLNDLRKMQKGPIGDHLTDEEFTGYVLEELAADQTERIDAHLSTCDACAAEAERLFEVSAAWMGVQGAIRMAALRQRIKAQMLAAHLEEALDELFKRLFPRFPVPQSAVSAASVTGRFVAKGQSEDGQVKWFIEEDPDRRDLVIRLSTSDLDLEDVRLYLMLVDLQSNAVLWQGSAILKKVLSNQLGAEVIMPRADRVEMPEKTALRVEAVLHDAGNPPAS